MLTLFVSCDGSLFSDSAMDAVDSIQVQRYDRVEARYLTTGDFSALQEMNTVYPTQTRALIEDILKLGVVSDIKINKRMLEFFQDTTLQNIIYAAESEYADISDITKELRLAFRNLRREMPGVDIPEFYVQIGALDQSIVVDNKSIGISLDKYLGSDYPTYLRFYDEEARAQMTREYIVPDVMAFYLLSRYKVSNYNEISQHCRDMYIGVIMYISNYLCERHVFHTEYVKKVESYMRSHPKMTVRNLLEMVDYSVIP